jgi:dienelactone hydrolase
MMTTRKARVCGGMLLFASLSPAMGAQALPVNRASAAARMVISPSSALIDQPVQIRVIGLHARRMTLEATARDSAGEVWRSRLAFAPRHGVVDTRSSMRLFWLMQPLRRHPAVGVLAPSVAGMKIRVRALVGRRAVAAAVLRWHGASASVSETPATLAAQGFVGTYFKPPLVSSTPAVLLLGGSEGGQQPYAAALLASDGYPTLSLAYFKAPGLPQQLRNIPLEYFAKALTWLRGQPGVDQGYVVVDGVSRGGEAALLIGATYPGLVHGVIACTPSSDVNGSFPPGGDAWTLNGKPVPQGPIAVEKIGGPALALGGGRDAVWPSGPYVDEIVQRAHKNGRRDIVGQIYPRAGHDVGFAPPNLPVIPWQTAGGTRFLEVGGTLLANEQARADAWSRVLGFLRILRSG